MCNISACGRYVFSMDIHHTCRPFCPTLNSAEMKLASSVTQALQQKLNLELSHRLQLSAEELPDTQSDLVGLKRHSAM